MAIVIKEDYTIVLKKFARYMIYTIVIAILAYLLDFIPTIEFPPMYAFLSGLLISVITSIKKSLEQYKPASPLVQ